MSFKHRKVQTPSTLGKKLLAARRRKKLSLEEAEAATKIRDKYIQALEGDDFKSLPGRVYAVGFVARYGEFLGMDPGRAVSQFRREYEVFARISGSDQLVLKSKIKEPKFVITPKVMLIAFSILAVLTLFGYIGYEVKKFSEPPQIEIFSPIEDTTAQLQIEVTGKTLPTATLQINGQSVALSDDGTFRQTVVLRKGLNTVEIRAKSRADKETVRVLRVYAELP